MPKLTPKQAQEKWASRLKSASQEIANGVDRVTEAPGKKAAAKADKMLAGIQRAINEGKWQDRVASVTLEAWKTSMKTKGVPRIAAGVDGAANKQEKFFGELFAYQEGLQGKIEQMPDVTLEDGINRATEWIRGMSRFRRTS